MAEKRQFELLIVRLFPHVLRSECVNVGVLLVEPAGGFCDVRFTKDWKRLECFAPNLEMEILEHLESRVRARLKEIKGREQLVQLLDENFGAMFDVEPVKALLAENPAAEMRVLERDYLEPMEAVERGRRARQTGRIAIVRKIENGLADAGVLEMVMRDLDMTEFTGKDDAFHVDFGYRVGRSVKMLQALALSVSRDPAVALAFRFTKIQEGMRKRGDEALMTAVVSEEALRSKSDVSSGIAMLRKSEVAVRGAGEMAEIAGEAKRELMA